MQKEITLLTDQLKDAYEGEPWFGRNAKTLLSEVDEQTASAQLNGQHSVLELVWHMVNWRAFAISHLAPSEKNLASFEEHDWQELNHADKRLWTKGLENLQQTQDDLIGLLQQKDDSILEQNVSERNYNYRKLITGIIQHDIYHLGQIALLTKALKASTVQSNL